jgi:hypothetical protein
MATKKTIASSEKVVFGEKKTGVYKKNYGPRNPKPKQYRGQGR